MIFDRKIARKVKVVFPNLVSVEVSDLRRSSVTAHNGVRMASEQSYHRQSIDHNELGVGDGVGAKVGHRSVLDIAAADDDDAQSLSVALHAPSQY
jgi:hypothetical protein